MKLLHKKPHFDLSRRKTKNFPIGHLKILVATIDVSRLKEMLPIPKRFRTRCKGTQTQTFASNFLNYNTILTRLYIASVELSNPEIIGIHQKTPKKQSFFSFTGSKRRRRRLANLDARPFIKFKLI